MYIWSGKFSTQSLRYYISKIRMITSREYSDLVTLRYVNVDSGAEPAEFFDFTEIPKEKLTLLHCISLYPTPAEKANLATISYLKSKYDVPVGYSDHTKGISACLYAVALGASLIEKHFTLDSTQTFGDHQLSAEPDEMRTLVEKIQECALMIGIPEKSVTEDERNMAKAMRRGLAAARDLSRGDVLKIEDLLPLRPESEIPVNRLDDIIGKKILVDKAQFEFLKPEELA